MNLDKILKEVIEIVKEGGEFIRQEQRNFNSTHLEFKGTNDLVSYVDRETEIMLVSGLRKLLPQAEFITEEGTVDQNEAELQWVIDPLDGTTNFVHSIPIFSVSVALLSAGVPILGVVYEINNDECFHAIKDGLAFCNGKEISVSSSVKLKDSMVASGFPPLHFNKLANYQDIITSLIRQSQGVRRLGSAAVDLAYVACGRFSCFFEPYLNSYDVAAGILIVQQAGGKVTDFQGGDNYIFGREIVAANKVHSSVLEIIQTHWR